MSEAAKLLEELNRDPGAIEEVGMRDRIRKCVENQGKGEQQRQHAQLQAVADKMGTEPIMPMPTMYFGGFTKRQILAMVAWHGLIASNCVGEPGSCALAALKHADELLRVFAKIATEPRQ